MTIVTMYTANLTAFLTINKMSISVNSVKDLLSQNEYQWGIIGSRYSESLLLNHIDPAYANIVKEGVQLQNLSHAIDKVRGGKFVFIDETPVIAHNLKDCDIFSVGTEFQTFEYAFGIAKHAPFAEPINTHIIKYREEGYMDGLWDKWSIREAACSPTSSENSLNLTSLAGIFYLLFIGIGTAILFTLIELIVVSITDCQTNKQLTFMKAARLRVQLKKEAVVYEWCGRVRPGKNNDHVEMDGIDENHAGKTSNDCISYAEVEPDSSESDSSNKETSEPSVFVNPNVANQEDRDAAFLRFSTMDRHRQI